MKGFSLIEIAVVLVIISVLATMVAIPLASQLEQKRSEETRKQIELAKEALMGYAMANGRLPCPANTGSNGAASYCTLGTGACVQAPAVTAAILLHGRCTDSNGLLPAVTLGVAPIDAQGFAIDAWEEGSNLHRLRYAVSKYEHPMAGSGLFPITATNGIRTATMDEVAKLAPASTHLYVCALGLAAPSLDTTCVANGTTTLTDRAAAIVYSLGKNGTTAFGDLLSDEKNNQGGNADIVFSAGDASATFDDITSWISLNTLFARMVQANKLP